MTTSQRSCTFYLAWFFLLYQCNEQGWHNVQTPDKRPIMRQDSFFWYALETVGRKLNVMRIQEQERLSRQ
jgi:hypothetical protein